MSWFVLKDQPNRRKRRGIWLRVRSDTVEDVFEKIKESKLKRTGEMVQRMEIKEVRSNGKVLLEVWCQSLADVIRHKNRHNVFHIFMDENPEWTCEGDLGRGMEDK